MEDPRAYIDTYKAAAHYIGMSPSELETYRVELKSCGVCFRKLIGRPPNRKVVIRFWKNLLQAWYMEKIQK